MGAVYSDADASALHVRLADEALHIGPSPAAESYLVGARIIEAAITAGAEAVHPGYGFLSENTSFAEAVIGAGIIWVSPSPDSIRAMGLKDAAKALMQKAGVPTTPGYLGEDQSPDRLGAEADKIGYPVLIKAVAGGGGKGMRKVDKARDFADALASCQREAKASFGDDRVLLEKWITDPRHIEVQIFGDSHGNIVHLFERDCTLQRRHQKVIEEAPAPGMDAATREAVCSAAVRAAEAVNYVGAGTVEFIADGSAGLNADRIWFMAEHKAAGRTPEGHDDHRRRPGRWQLQGRVRRTTAETQGALEINGSAMGRASMRKTRQPASCLQRASWRFWHRALIGSKRALHGRWCDAFHHDPMIAKLVTHGANRDAARFSTPPRTRIGVSTWPIAQQCGLPVQAVAQRRICANSTSRPASSRSHLGDLVTAGNWPDAAVSAAARKACGSGHGLRRFAVEPAARF
ncbi:MAG: biotin carboxylase N-terminal domain-containing protein [Hyphomonas sp.]